MVRAEASLTPTTSRSGCDTARRDCHCLVYLPMMGCSASAVSRSTAIPNFDSLYSARYFRMDGLCRFVRPDSEFIAFLEAAE